MEKHLLLPWGVEQKKDSYLGTVGQAIAPVFKPLGFGTVVGTMGEIYVPEKKEKPAGSAPSLSEDFREIGTSFAEAGKKAFTNVFSTAEIASISKRGRVRRSGKASVRR